ncbi:ABC-type transport system involved in multi-copper enzyme maturation permease subunit [Duganella sp. SG902]|uniref:ABC transporter permease n=1 Tax=Duganella sp. SG902 TaxID=2587016 RepID=UPI00159DA202|nr:ABC transporter permease [Duganella sp. SG902]NVM78542.1 ABC-type transport system involved in multi-copper enzyme maturation permease subunit [Duganella sp. SG902]
MMAPAFTIARYTLLEALRNRLLWLLLLMAAGAVAVSGFLNELALTESRQLQAALLGAVLRLAAVFLVATFVVTSMAREASDKGLELLMALPLPRAVYLFGKLAGFGALALLPALLFGALGLFFAPPAQAALWAFSLLCECWIVAAFSVLCMLTLSQVLPALAAAFAFYLLARVIAALQLLGHGAASVQSASQQALNAGIDALALLLPHLDQFTRSDWLVYHSGGAAELATIATQTAIYVTLLAAAALFDLHRKHI